MAPANEVHPEYPECVIRTGCGLNDRHRQRQTFRRVAHLVQSFVDEILQDGGFNESIIRQYVDVPEAFGWGQLQQHLENQLEEDGRIFAAREPHDPRRVMILKVFVLHVGPDLVQPFREIHGQSGGRLAHMGELLVLSPSSG